MMIDTANAPRQPPKKTKKRVEGQDDVRKGTSWSWWILMHRLAQVTTLPLPRPHPPLPHTHTQTNTLHTNTLHTNTLHTNTLDTPLVYPYILSLLLLI